jgi:hypothetical protein
MSHMKGGFDWIRSHYPVPAKPGMRIECDGRAGRITSVAGGHLVLHFDGEPARRRHHAHPCWRVKYFGPDGELLKDTTEMTS